MKIKSLIIYGYGKWIDQSIDFSSDFHVVFGQNEAGKSTIMSFIHSILFGFPTRHSALLRYEPKDSSRYGGKIIIEDERFGVVSIERVQGKSTGDVTVLMEDGATGSEALLHKILYGIDRTLYQSVFSFHLKGIERVEDMTKDQMNRYFLSAGALGTERFLQKADQFKQKANGLYKPTGRVPKINQALKGLEEKQAAMELAKSKNSEYLDLLQKVEELNQEIEEQERTQKDLNRRIQKLKQFEQNFEAVETIKQLEKEIEQLNTSKLNENSLYEMNTLNKQIEDIQKEIRTQQALLKGFEEEYEPSSQLILYQEHEQSIDALAVQIGSIDDLIREQKYVYKELEKAEQEITKKRIQLDLSDDEQIPTALTKAEKETLAEWQRETNLKESGIDLLKEKLTTIGFKISSLEESIDELEQNLWSNEQFRKEEDHFEAKPATRSQAIQLTKEMSILLVSIVLIISTLLLDLPFMLLWILLAVSLIMGSIFSTWEKMHKKDQDSAQISYEDYIRQKEIRRQWRDYLFNSDKLESEKQFLHSEIASLETEIENIQNDWSKFKEDRLAGYRTVLSTVLQFEEMLSELRVSESERNKVRDHLEELKTALFLKTEQFDQVSELFSEEDTPTEKISKFKVFYQQVKEERNQLQQYMIESQEARRSLNRSIESEKTILRKKNQLLQEAGADSEEVFRHLYGILKQKNEKEERLKVLKEQLPENHLEIKADSIEDIRSQEKQLQQDVLNVTSSIKSCTQEKIEIEVHIKRLEEGGEYTTLLQEFENEKSHLQELVNSWVTSKLASNIIEKTLKYARKDRFPQTIMDAENYFSYLTQGKYTKIVIDDETVFILNNEGHYFRADELSRGTAEPLYVALRLAFINNIKDTIRMPLLVDDGFVNLDRTRRTRMYELLKEISQTTQVIYFSFDQQSLESLEDGQKTILTKV
ncbi:AAA family ATPase [Marinilactibacillus sp. Marseille-P9653]|uniref:ATP-binding protein n=1 Tax=Marinilactibacillus sp. Marseille-P9653 TaxID=2866583 RepID=UPI001CE430DB|nr:AAA family ATPase [Marinilactibacillus sp. Marseille-P9653]